MKKITCFALTAAAVVTLAQPAIAEDEFTRHGRDYATEGWSGSVAFGPSLTWGNADEFDLTLAGRLRYNSGTSSYGLDLRVVGAEDGGVRQKEEVFLSHNFDHYVSERTYVFGLGSLRYDGVGSREWDVFTGAGAGYLVVNRPGTTWRIQAGPGVRHIIDNTGCDVTEAAGLVSWRGYREITDRLYFTGDTDILFSEDSAIVSSELALTYALTDTLSARTSLRNTYDSNPLAGREEFDRALNVSLMARF